MGKGSTTSSGQPSRSLGSKGGTSLPPSYENRSSQQMDSGLGAIFNQIQPLQLRRMQGAQNQIPAMDMRYRGGPETQQQKVFRDQRELNMLGAQNQARQYQTPEQLFQTQQYGYGSVFNNPQQVVNPLLASLTPNPYTSAFENRYVQQFRPTPAPFVPVSARDYVSPFPQRGKGGRGEQTYFNRPIETAPTPTPTPTPTPSSDDGYDGRPAGGRAGGVVKAAAGRYLQGPGDGTSDSIPATIGNTQPARLADGEFVIDARTVSEIGNGSSNAGAKKLYAMMERVHRERKKAKRGQNTNADRFLPV